MIWLRELHGDQIAMPSFPSFFSDHATAVQVFLFAGLLTSLWVVEFIVAVGPFGMKWNHARLNGTLILFTLPVQLAMTTFVVAAAGWTSVHHWGLLQLLPFSSSVVSKYLLAFVLLDFCDYLYHVTMHKLSWLWRFHLVHHSDQDLDVSTTLREHPGETFVRVCFLIVWVLFLGVSWPALLLRQTAETVSNLTSHSRCRLPASLDRILGWIFITPNLHHVHHHHERPYTDRNYGDVFSVWDRLFGTYAQLQICVTKFGIDTHPRKQITENFKEVMLLPFRRGPRRDR
jgi:sterol desaturase/sphingolipid hydroxylase (fatty acid hydroxylase superfamily)